MKFNDWTLGTYDLKSLNECFCIEEKKLKIAETIENIADFARLHVLFKARPMRRSKYTASVFWLIFYFGV